MKDLQLGTYLRVEFPTNEEGVATLIGFEGVLPARFGTGVSLESYNDDWLGKSETGQEN